MTDILRIPQVKSKTGHRSNASVYTAIRDGLFTNGVAIGARARGWPEHEVDAINRARTAGKSESQIRSLVARLHAQRVLDALEADGQTEEIKQGCQGRAGTSLSGRG